MGKKQETRENERIFLYSKFVGNQRKRESKEATMLHEILPWVERIWVDWNIRGVLLFSLFLQTLLIALAPLRKATGKSVFLFLIWISYLLADWAATYGVGLIATTQRYGSQQTTPENKDLLAFWAPFLILHLGGPDAITALALEDNELWLRHLLSLISQVGTALYVFALSLPNNKIWFPTLLMFTAGVIKYVERTCALFLASFNKFRDSLMRPNYFRLLVVYDEEENETGNEIHDLSDAYVVLMAYQCFTRFQELVVDLNLSSETRNESRSFFRHLEAETALRVLEVELNFIYDILYTKVRVIRSLTGYILRALAFGVVLASLGYFHFKITKNGFKGFDVRVTYTLMLGAIALDLVSLFMLIFSDWTLVALKRYSGDEEEAANESPVVKKLIRQLASALTVFIKWKRPLWYPFKCREHGRDAVRHHVLATPILFRRWSGSISRLNLIGFCLNGSPQRIHEFTGWSRVVTRWIMKWSGIELVYHTLYSSLKEGINKVCKTTRISRERPWSWSACMVKIAGSIQYFTSKLFGSLGLENTMRFVSKDRLTRELWTFIFHELKHKSDHAADPQTAKKMSSARGDWTLTNMQILDYYKKKFMAYVTDDMEFSTCLLMWHIATELCYHEGDNIIKEDSVEQTSRQENVDQDTAKSPEFNAHDYREFSKMLSDYMVYLIVMQSNMVSAVAGAYSKLIFKQTSDEASLFFKGGPKDQQEACKQILHKITDEMPADVEGPHKGNVLVDACILAKKLIVMEEETRVSKWDLLSKMWAELLCHAAVHCKARTQFQQLRNGGELITFVWLLMVHFGFSDYYKISSTQAVENRQDGQDQSSPGEPAPEQIPQNHPGVLSSADTQTQDTITEEIV